MSRFRTVLEDVEIIEGVKKHGEHDQKTHGNWATGGTVYTSIIDRLSQKDVTGFSLDISSRNAPQSGYMTSDAGAEESVSYDDFFSSRDRSRAILLEYIEKNAQALSDRGAYFGIWVVKDQGTVYLDVSRRYDTRAEAVRAGFANEQQSVYDIENDEYIYMKDEEDDRTNKAVDGGSSNPRQSNDPRAEASLRGGDSQRNRKESPHICLGRHQGVEKHLEGQHDQATHGSWASGRFGPDSVKAARDGAKEYAFKAGIKQDDSIDYQKTVANRARAGRIADAYDELPVDDPKAYESYTALATEVEAQFDYMTEVMGIKVEFVAEDPYKTSREMFADVSKGVLKVLSTASTGSHPFLSDEQNDKFRAVHDFFGHAATGRGFGQDGEESAWVHHSQMFTETARGALTTETRGQNSWYNSRGKVFAEQKVALLPKEFWEVPDTFEKAYKVIRFEAGLIPVLKHGEHDQSSHGSWATGGVLFKQDKNLLTMQDKSGKTLASVNFVNLGNNRLDINSIDSFDEGKGYATKVLEKLYSSFPQHSIFWGKTILPASTHLAQKFFDKYGRTEFMPWGEGAIAGYEWGELYGDTTVKKHQEHDQSTHGSWADGYTPEERARMDEMSTLGPALEDLDAILEGGGPGPDLDDLKMLVENDEGLYSEAISGIEERVAAYLENYPNAEYNTVFDEEQTKMIDEFIDNSDPGYLAGLWMEQEGMGDTEEMLSNVTPYFEEIFNTDHTVVNAAGDAVTRLSSEIQYVGMTTDTPSGDEGISVKGKIEDSNGNYAGEFERIFYKEDGVWIVEHKLLKLDDDYKGLGFGKEFIDRSEDWYTQRGFGAIMVGTGWDGARVWARDGFDWQPEEIDSSFRHIVVNKITNMNSADELDFGQPAREEFDALMRRATNGYESDENGPRWDSIKDFRNEDFPLPNDFLMIGYKDKTTSDYEHPVTGDTKKAVTWAGERLLDNLNLDYVKILTPEGRNLFEGPVDRDGDGLVYDGTAREKPASAVKS